MSLKQFVMSLMSKSKGTSFIPSPESKQHPESSKIGSVFKLASEVKEFEWRIPDFLFLIENKTDFARFSPTFSIGNDDLYYLKLDVMSTVNQCYLALICSRGRSDFLIYFSLKKADGILERLDRGIVIDKDGPTCCLPSNSEIKRRKSELVPSNILTITITIRHLIAHPSQPVELNKAEPLQLISLAKLSKNFKDLLGDKETCDVILKVKDKDYKAHKSVLIARSKVFAANFKHDTLERQTGIITVEDCDPDSFQEFLEYLYSGKLEEISFRKALNLYYTSDKYDIEELKTFCIDYIMKQCLTVENICDVVVFADKYDEKKLFSAAQIFFNEHAKEVFKTSEWTCLMRQDHRLVNQLLIDLSNLKL